MNEHEEVKEQIIYSAKPIDVKNYGKIMEFCIVKLKGTMFCLNYSWWCKELRNSNVLVGR